MFDFILTQSSHHFLTGKTTCKLDTFYRGISERLESNIWKQMVLTAAGSVFNDEHKVMYTRNESE